ncbi:YqzL family protein [Dethiothermospora halolimnae]
MAKRGVNLVISARFYWKVFKLTGSVDAYLMYKKLLIN